MSTENVYQANENNLFIPSKLLKIYPQAQGIDIKPNGKGTSNFTFVLSDYLNIINPEKLRLRYQLEMSGRGGPKPNPVAGVHSLFRHMRLQTENGQHLLEEVNEYSSRVAMEYSYSQDEKVIHDRELNEGLSLTDSPENQLFWKAEPLTATETTSPNVAKRISIQQPLYSGLVGKDSTAMPVSAVGGLRLTMEMNNIRKSLLINERTEEGLSGFTVDAEVPLTQFNGDENHTVDIRLNKIITADYREFEIGDHIYAKDGGSAQIDLGALVKVKFDSGNSNKIVLEVKAPVAKNTDGTTVPAGSKVYTKKTERFNGWSPVSTITQGTSAEIVQSVAQAKLGISYTISDLEMIVEQLQPPQSFVDSLVKKINSKDGLTMNYKNVSLLKVNLTGKNGLLNASIPNTAQRVYSLNVMPLRSVDVENADNLTADSPDGIVSYQFVINNQLTPDQRVEMGRLSQTIPKVEQLHITELHKSLLNSGVMVRSLQRPEKNVVIGRATSLFGAVSDITKSDLQLRLEYDDNVNRYQKTLNCYVCSARTLVIKRDMVDVVY
jgi:hypothetical protein